MNKHKYSDGKWTRTKAAVLWSGMRARCVPGGSQQRRNPAYLDSTLSAEFSTFDGFLGWYKGQPAFNLGGYEVDKDLAGGGERHYSRETCRLIPKALNLFLGSRKSSVRGLPAGVRLAPSGRFLARVRIDSECKTIGTYSTSEEARAAYVAAKNAESLRWATRLEAGEFLVDKNVICLIRSIDWGAR